MSPAMSMVADGALVVLFALVAVFVWRERAGDEREELHRMMADRFAFLVGSGALVILIIYQSYHHSLDVYVPIILLLMILTKITGRIYSRLKH